MLHKQEEHGRKDSLKSAHESDTKMLSFRRMQDKKVLFSYKRCMAEITVPAEPFRNNTLKGKSIAAAEEHGSRC